MDKLSATPEFPGAAVHNSGGTAFAEGHGRKDGLRRGGLGQIAGAMAGRLRRVTRVESSETARSAKTGAQVR
jgi:hypothetical protein